MRPTGASKMLAINDRSVHLFTMSLSQSSSDYATSVDVPLRSHEAVRPIQASQRPAAELAHLAGKRFFVAAKMTEVVIVSGVILFDERLKALIGV
jgi:hypothetical protein